MGDTIRVTHVTLRFFMFLMSFATFKPAYRQNLKEKGQRTMRKRGKKLLFAGSIFIVTFIIWTLLIQKIDVRPLGANGTNIGFATINCWFHKLTGVHMTLYTITDWMGLIPIFICMIFGVMGLIQLIQRRSLFKVDYDIIFLGIYYVLVYRKLNKYHLNILGVLCYNDLILKHMRGHLLCRQKQQNYSYPMMIKNICSH